MNNRGEKMQQQVLSVLRQHTSAMSAYDLLDALRKAYPKIAPPTIYRALSSLTESGCIHRVESLKAYIACECGDQTSVLSICDDCGSVEENRAHDLVKSLSSIVGESGFLPNRHVIEVHGTCADCGEASSSALQGQRK